MPNRSYDESAFTPDAQVRQAGRPFAGLGTKRGRSIATRYLSWLAAAIVVFVVGAYLASR